MLKIYIVIIIIFSLSFICSSKTLFKVKFGNNPEQLSFYKSNVSEKFSIGPKKIKIIKKNIVAILDSLKGCILIYKVPGKLLKKIDISSIKKDGFIKDFAISKGKIFVLGPRKIYIYKNGGLRIWFASLNKNFNYLDNLKVSKKFIVVSNSVSGKSFIINRKNRKYYSHFSSNKMGYSFNTKGELYFIKKSFGNGYSIWKYDLNKKLPLLVSFIGYKDKKNLRIESVYLNKVLFSNYGSSKLDFIVTDIYGKHILEKKIDVYVPWRILPELKYGVIYYLDFFLDKKSIVEVKAVRLKGMTLPFINRENNSEKYILQGKVYILKKMKDGLYFVNESGIFKFAGGKSQKVISFNKMIFKGANVGDFSKIDNFYYVLTKSNFGKVYKINSNSEIINSFPEIVEEEPIFKHPSTMFFSEENDVICITDNFLGRSVCLDMNSGEFISMIYGYSNGILTPQMFFLTGYIKNTNYYISIIDSQGNEFDKKGPFSMENKIAFLKIIPRVRPNGEFIIYLEDKFGKGVIEKYDFKGELILRVKKKIPYYIKLDRIDFDNDYLYYISGKNKLIKSKLGDS